MLVVLVGLACFGLAFLSFDAPSRRTHKDLIMPLLYGGLGCLLLASWAGGLAWALRDRIRRQAAIWIASTSAVCGLVAVTIAMYLVIVG